VKAPRDFTKARLIVLMLCCGTLAGAVLGRAVLIQVIGDSRLETMARRQFQSKVLIRPRRGLIMDRNGEPLAVNIDAKSLAANPAKIQNRRTLARLLSKATDISYAKLLKKLKENREFVWIKRHISEDEMNRLKKWSLIDADGELVSGLWMVKESKRVYPQGELAAHVLGAVNLDSEGLEGVELWTNEELRGKVVSVSAVKDALGRPTFIDAVAAQHVRDGSPITLTLDASLQFSVEQELRSALVKSNAMGGSAIVMNAETGEILAMVNEPTFNPNHKDAPAAHRRNRVLTDGYEPGSTLKPVLLATALLHGWRLSDQVWGERGSFVVQGKRISEAESHEKFEWISLKKLIQVSSNIGAAKLALKVGADHYYNMLKNFGFGGKTNSGFPGEISGRIPARPARKDWQPLTLANVGFGQGILVTRLQMLRAYAAFANGGWLVQPTLLKTPIKGFVTDPPKRVLSQKIVDSIVEALKSATADGGTGTKANLEGYVLAGKTGTAQEVDPETKKYSRSKFVASFIGFPVGTQPKLVIFVSVEEPRGVYYASDIAAPLFKNIFAAAANRFSLPAQGTTPSRVLAKTRSASPPVSDRVGWSLARAMEWQGTALDGSATWKMPSLVGLTPREAIRVLQGHKFRLQVHGVGVIQSQAPEQGKVIADGSLVRLTLSEP
jgi:cell division protein FtsI (penicillin-binding protein 3)